jgi:hypothetical protein
VIGLTPNCLTPTCLRMKRVLEARWPSRRGVSFSCAAPLKRHDVFMVTSRAKETLWIDSLQRITLGGFKREAQQGVNERKLMLSKRLRAYVRTPRMANEMHG